MRLQARARYEISPIRYRTIILMVSSLATQSMNWPFFSQVTSLAALSSLM